MRTKPIVFLAASVLACGAAGQSTADEGLDRTFHLSHQSGAEPELATVIQATADLRQVTTDPERRSLSIHGTPDQIALTEWLLKYLDAPPSASESNAAAPRYQLPLSRKDEANVVGVFYLPHVETAQSLQEVATTVRSVSDTRRLFIYTARKAMVVRGTAVQIDLADWLVKELDQPAYSAGSMKREYTVPGPGFPDNVVRVFSLKPDVSPQRFQEIAKQVRVTTEVRRLFTYNAPRVITLRGTPGQVEQAYQMISEVNR